MIQQLIQILTAFLPLGTDSKTKDSRSRLLRFSTWLSKQQGGAFRMADYRDHLLYEVKMSPSSVKSHLSTIRVFLRGLMSNPAFRESHLATTDPDLAQDQREALVELQISRLREAIEPGQAPVEHQPDKRRNKYVTERHMADAWERNPINTPIELRDTFIITLMTATGIRETEVCALDVSDLRQEFEGQLALHVPKTVGGDERFVPYRDMGWVLEVADTWRAFADIRSGPVFRGFYKSGNIIRPGRLSVRAIARLMTNYPVVIDGQPTLLKPLDLRHLYARHLYNRHRLSVEKMQQYLGIRSLETLWSYIGNPSEYRSEDFHFDLSKLDQWKQA